MFVLEVLLPLILIVVAGFLSTKKGVFSHQFIAETSKFVLYVSLPAVIISSLTSIELGKINDPNFMLVYAVAGLSAMAIAILTSRHLLKCNWTESFINGLGSGMPNSAFIGLPVVLSLYNGQYVEAFLMCVLVENLVLIPTCLVLLECAQGKTSTWQSQVKVVAGRIGRNQLFWRFHSRCWSASPGLPYQVFLRIVCRFSPKRPSLSLYLQSVVRLGSH